MTANPVTFTEAAPLPPVRRARTPHDRSRVRLATGGSRRRVVYEERPFICWDGEGITDENGNHRYVLFANSLGEYIAGTHDEPLSHRQCWEFMLATREANPDGIHVIYGGNYDANMMMQGFDRWEVAQVYQNEWAHVRGYRIRFRPGKCLTVSRGWQDGTGDRRSITLYDAMPFFQCSFVTACDEYLGDDWPNRALVVKNKALRSTFTAEDLPEVLAYCFAELKAFNLLMVELRRRLHKVGLKLHRWDGPGAIAGEYLKAQGVRAHLSRHGTAEVPEGVASAARFAYAGGRFEVLRCGHTDKPTYEYDINSAYPYAMTFLPSLAHGHWLHHDSDPGPREFALYHVHYRWPHSRSAHPLFCRGRDGTVWYPYGVIGWYWSPEVASARSWVAEVGGELEILEAWSWHPTTSVKPFAFVHEAYAERAALKKANDGAHVGLKLALNSMYGKCAQQIGWRQYEKELRLPPYHQLEWAGFVTSFTRAMVFDALRTAENGVVDGVAFETDAVFSSTKLHVPLGDGLGEWKETILTDLTYLQSGIYFATDADGNPIEKYRGIDKGTLTRAMVLDAYRDGLTSVEAPSTRFITMGQALNQQWRKWTRWVTSTRRVDVVPTEGKRSHIPQACPQCVDNQFTIGELHDTICIPSAIEIHSHEFPVEWVNPDPAMRHLHDERLAQYDQAWE